ncbi:MAG: septum formation inhibitor Maf [Patiriisocius sp.]|uniref:septum formation inhibitor Maf n=1 Tax=Patiriisocius sp. TaxID=2822396 RepID=UPI003EF9B59A
MKKIFLLLITSLLFFTSCETKKDQKQAVDTSEISNSENSVDAMPRTLPKEFSDYWFAGTAEISSYTLSQSRYGEIREGTAVTVFVTEDFNPKLQVKADSQAEENISMLKLNLTKKFNTGIYPYSIMTSTFNPINDSRHALKIANSVQEWCGQTYMQLNNKANFEISAHSYFESEADQELSLEKVWLEDELWNIIRLNPSELPVGEFKVIPAFETIRLAHKEIKAYNAIADTKRAKRDNIYTLTYPELNKEIRITYRIDFPHTIESWEETHADGTITTAKLMKRIQSPYWNRNSEKYSELREELGL